MVTLVGQFAGVGAVVVLGGALLNRFGAQADGWRDALLWLTAPLLAISLLSTLSLREPLRIERLVEDLPRATSHRRVLVATVTAAEPERSNKVGRPWPVLLIVGCRPRAFFIPGLTAAFSSNTQGGSRVPESGPLGSVRGVRSDAHPYRDCRFPAVPLEFRVK
ncbi:MAG TPA: hypothetical protein VGQ22_00020 [Steroidobacteraceae bacterium]|nr:hypothetical protein [Steroidobacteraceae bacterium]